MSDDKPFFRFHPGAYERGAFVQSSEPCGVCGRPSVWLYAGIVYSSVGKPSVCARCIADGSLSAHLDGDYSLHDADLEDEVDADLESEVMQRTPGFATFNGFEWPVLDGKPLVFVGHGDEDATWENEEAAEAIRRLFEEEHDEILDGPTPYAIAFREIDGPRYVAIVDFD